MPKRVPSVTPMLEHFSELIRLRTAGLLLYRARATPATDDWWSRTRAWLDLAWTW